MEKSHDTWLKKLKKKKKKREMKAKGHDPKMRDVLLLRVHMDPPNCVNY